MSGAPSRRKCFLMGHAKLNTTAHYSQVDNRALRAVRSPLELLPAKKRRKKVS